MPQHCCQNTATYTRQGPHSYGFPFELEIKDPEINSTMWTLARATITISLGMPAIRLEVLNASFTGELSGGVRYAYDAWPLCVLKNAQELPLAPFVSVWDEGIKI